MSLKKERDREDIVRMCYQCNCDIGRFIFDLINDENIKDGDLITTGELCQLYYKYYKLFITAITMTKLLNKSFYMKMINGLE